MQLSCNPSSTSSRPYIGLVFLGIVRRDTDLPFQPICCVCNLLVVLSPNLDEVKNFIIIPANRTRFLVYSMKRCGKMLHVCSNLGMTSTNTPSWPDFEGWATFWSSSAQSSSIYTKQENRVKPSCPVPPFRVSKV